ncbi:MAG TPA: ABC transporter permease [Chthoniobacteraceae bacterium]|jgi:ABC-2 type transport system permease protein|nr:ABC transporter permease [Chthoniobacteraceae bacterium]
MASPSQWLFFRQLRGELWKLFARKRTYIGFGAYLAFEVLILSLSQLPMAKNWFQHFVEGQGFSAEHYASGLTLGFSMVSWTVVMLGPLFLALVTGDIVAKEVEDGTMRMILSRPVSRSRVVLVRYVAALVYTAVLIAFIAGSALLFGLAKSGAGGMFVFSPREKILALYEFGPGLQRYLCTIPFLALSFTAVSSIGFFFSCCNMKPAAATILCLAVHFIDHILSLIPQFTSIHQYLLTTHMMTWMNIYRPVVPVLDMVQDYAVLLGIDGTLLVLGIMVFQSRDFKA